MVAPHIPGHQHIVALYRGWFQPTSPTVQGRCKPCGSAFIWPRKLGLLRHALCPFCKGPLRQTTHRLRSASWWLLLPGYRGLHTYQRISR